MCCSADKYSYSGACDSVGLMTHAYGDVVSHDE